MAHKNKQYGSFNKNLYNRLLDECGDSDIKNGNKCKVDPALKFLTIIHWWWIPMKG